MNGPLGFGERLRALREARRMSLGELARAIEREGHYVTPETLGKYERREVYPGCWHLVHIARFFNVSIDALLDHHPKENENAREQLAG